MRLLHFDESRGLVLTDFREKSVPPYAILSHRWGDDEVLFEDLFRHNYKYKTGYQKIKFCAEQAAQDRLHYFWIDTCCIDKWNLRERSKAINSMYYWYQNATKCYVYLLDVSASNTNDARQHITWEASFRNSDWFTRGWTLQELIAPASVEFFSSEGRRLGDKESLKQLIHKITNIPIEALKGHHLDKFSISDRMTWAEARKTTEPEDAAYCQLGLLNINMPLNYGEGKEKALSRLQEELKTSNTTPSVIPFFQNDRFVGRQAQLAEVEERLFSSKQTTMIAVTGEGGVGKSQLALEVAHRTRQKYKNCSVFWIDASNINSLHQAYLSIAQKLKVPGWDSENADTKYLVKQYLSTEGAGQWLLVFDNLDDMNLRSTGLSTLESANLINYLPQSKLGSIIFTTASSDIAKKLTVQDIIKLHKMTAASAEELFEKYLLNPVPLGKKQEMNLLLKDLSYLPLAIVQAAAYINVTNTTFRDYRTQLLTYEEEAFKSSSELSNSKLQDARTKKSVTTTLLISLDQIRHNHSLAARYLFLMACVDRKDIPLDVLEATSDSERDDAIRILSAYALVTRRPAESALDLHRLVHVTIQQWLREQKWLDQWAQNAIKRLVEIYPDHNHGSRSKWRRLLPHATYALSCGHIDQEDENRTSLIWKCAMTLLSDGQYKESEELFVRVMDTSVRVLGDDHPDTLTSMANLASTFWNQGRW
jgi:hypothetical protein